MKKDKLLYAKIIELPKTAAPLIKIIAKKKNQTPKGWIETIILNALNENTQL